MMIKYSIIVPAYNAEKTLYRCIESILAQKYDNYELIIVDDGSTDESFKILDQYKKANKRVNIFKQKNSGAGSARNLGVAKAKGQYLLFLDSDDYVTNDYLEVIDNNLDTNLDLLRFQITDVDGKQETNHSESSFDTMSGPEAFELMTKFKYLDSPVCYCYNKKYYDNNKFKFMENTYHEDYALVPLIIMKAQRVKGINKCIYAYVKTQDSTMTSTDYKKTIKKFDDAIKGYLFQMKEIDKLDYKETKIFKSYISNAIIVKLKDLNKLDYVKYLKRLKELKVIDNILTDTLLRKIKYLLIKINPRIALKLLIRK